MDPQRLKELQAQINHVLSRQLFFVVGAPKSGTTWLQRLLDAHPAVLCSGEGHFADKIAAPLSQVFEAYNRHQKLVTTRVYENKPYYTGLGQDYLDYAVLSLTCLSLAQREISAEVTCIGDKTPRHTFFLGRLGAIFPDAKFLHIIRDGRDTVVSLCHHALRAGDAQAIDRDSAHFLELTARFSKAWAQNVRAARRFGAANRDRYREVRYEALQDDPDSALGGLLEFLGVAATPDMIRLCRESAAFEKWSGGRRRGEESKTSFFRKGVAGDWRNFFNEPALEAFARQTGDLLDQLGYR